MSNIVTVSAKGGQLVAALQESIRHQIHIDLQRLAQFNLLSEQPIYWLTAHGEALAREILASDDEIDRDAREAVARLMGVEA